MAQPQQQPTRRRFVVWGLQAAVVAVLVGVLVSNAGELGEAADRLSDASWHWFAVAVAAEAVSVAAFVVVQRVLLAAGGVRPRFRALTAITLAGEAIAFTVPGGAALAGIYTARQLRRRGASTGLAMWTQLAAAVMAGLGLALLGLLGVIVARAGSPVAALRPYAVGGLVVALALLGVLQRPKARHWLARSGTLNRLLGGDASSAATQAVVATPPPIGWRRGVVLTLLAGLFWVGDCACLAAALEAVGLRVPYHTLLGAYVLGQVVSMLPVTPGGIGVVEGSLAFFLAGPAHSTSGALAAVLAYRLVSFWGLNVIGWGLVGGLAWRGRRRAPAADPERTLVEQVDAVAEIPLPDTASA